ncbi:MAG: aldehyde dehydrogenase (NADP(+)) [Bacteroidota bacterium]
MILGANYIGFETSKEGNTSFFASTPAGDELSTPFFCATENEIDRASEMAQEAFLIYRKSKSGKRAVFLENIGKQIMALGDTLLERCSQETALPLGRLQGERGRTVNQLNLFAKLLREGSWVDARIDTALPDRQPIPKPDIRQMNTAIGPVAVFGASNFPLAFSVAGGDTASALAAGCPVIVKGHPAHAGTSELVARAIVEAARESGMPEGVFSLVQGNTNAVGERLVQNPNIKAVGFTGSYRGGKALFDIAAQRAEPIPVFAEMGSVNPVFILPSALEKNGTAIASALVGSIALGVGQFCTNPGLVFARKSQALPGFQTALQASARNVAPAEMLTGSIKKVYQNTLANYREMDVLEEVTENGDSSPLVAPSIFKTDAAQFMKEGMLSEENFGPSSILVEAGSDEEIYKAAKALDGHLTATIIGDGDDFEKYASLIDILDLKVGRLIINGYPTGVEVCHSMVHGGPFPATTAPATTSVGTKAIERFVRPVCYQNFPENLLPEALKDSNPQQIWRLVNGEYTKAVV